MKTFLIFILTIVSFFYIYSCETTERIDEFPLRPSKMVVNCFFTENLRWEIQVSKSLSVLDNANLGFIENATIKIFNEYELVESINSPDSDNWYRSPDNTPIAENEYSIEVSSPDFESVVFAKEVLPGPVSISVTDVFNIDTLFDQYYSDGDLRKNWGYARGKMNVSFSDPPEEENFYELSIFWYDTIFTDAEHSTIDDIKTRRLNLSTEDISARDDESNKKNLLFTDQFFNAQNYQLMVDFIDKKAFRDKKCIVQLVTLSRSGYLYRSSIDDFKEASKDPFSEPVQIYGNIENGLGIFAAYSISLSPVELY